jgi:hypothetical protein
LQANSQLPIEVVWAPIAKSEGDASFTLHVKNINGAKTVSRRPGRPKQMFDNKIFISINVTEKEYGPDDDIPLPISIYTAGGMPAWLWQNLTMAGGIISFVLGSALLMGWVSRFWALGCGTDN